MAIALVAAAGALAPGQARDPNDKQPLPVGPTPPTGGAVQAMDPPAEPGRPFLNGVLLSAERYQELLDELAQLRGKELAPKEVSPTKVVLTKGHVEGSLVYFKVQIDFVTERRNSLLPLAFTLGQPTDLMLDGRTPAVRQGADGLGVLVNRPGEHRLVFDVVGRLTESTQRAGCLVLKLDLPRAPDTQFDLTLPDGFKELRVNDRPVGEWSPERAPGEGDAPGQQPILKLQGRRLTGQLLLGSSDKLQMSWRGPRAATGPLQTAAEGKVLVTVDDRHMVRTEATLTLKVLSNQTDQWRLLVPAGAQVKMATAADEARLKDAADLELPFFRICTLTLKERSAEPLTVVVTQEPTVLRPGEVTTPVGPFLVVGAARQSGTLLVSNGAADLGLRCVPAAATTSRTLAADEARQPAPQGYHYHGVPLVSHPRDPRELALLVLQAEAKRGQLSVRPVYQLRLPRTPGDRNWQLLTSLDVHLVEPGVHRLEILLPADCRYVPTAEEDRPLRSPVLGVDVPPAVPALGTLLVGGGAAGLARSPLVLHLSRDRWEDFKFSFRIQYARPATPSSGATFWLPRYRDAAEVLTSLSATVGVPEDLELLVPVGGNGSWELTRQAAQELTWKPDAADASPPDRLAVAWRPYRSEVRASSDVNLELLPRVGRVRQELKLQFPRGVPPLLPLRLPPGLVGLRVARGGALQTVPTTMPVGGALCYVKPDDGASRGTEWDLALTYEFPLAERPAVGDAPPPFAVPLVTVDPAAAGETRVRVWSEPGALPLPAGEGWSELAVEPAPPDPRQPSPYLGRLPVLVLHSERPNTPLSLRLGEPGPGPSAEVLTDRALIRVTLEGGGQGVAQVRARFRLLKLFAHHLDVELPAPVARLNLHATLDGLAIDPETLDNRTGMRSDSGTVARLRLGPDLVHRGSILELKYEVRAGQQIYQALLQPPVLVRSEPGQLAVCWQVVLPAGVVAIGPENGSGAHRAWGWRGWLLAPQPAARADELERWIAGPDAAAPTTATEVGALVCFREGYDALHVTYAPQQTWLLVCSLTLLVVALGVYLLLRRALGVGAGRGERGGRVAWLVVLLLAIAGVGVGLVWPTLTAALAFGAEPGAAVLVLVLLSATLWHERRRRRTAYLPSFRRGQPNSSLVRPASPPPLRPPGEPSTVDVPRPGSGQYPAASEAARSESSR